MPITVDSKNIAVFLATNFLLGVAYNLYTNRKDRREDRKRIEEQNSYDAMMATAK